MAEKGGSPHTKFMVKRSHVQTPIDVNPELIGPTGDTQILFLEL